jgi:hypothetical protein
LRGRHRGEHARQLDRAPLDLFRIAHSDAADDGVAAGGRLRDGRPVEGVSGHRAYLGKLGGRRLRMPAEHRHVVSAPDQFTQDVTAHLAGRPDVQHLHRVLLRW